MSAVVLMFLAFALSISWVAGDQEKDSLNTALTETKYVNKTMLEQVNQAKTKAARDTEKMEDMRKQVSVLTGDKKRLQGSLKRTKLRRKTLLKPQITKLKDQLEEQYRAELHQVEAKLDETSSKLANLEEENRALKDKYLKLRRGVPRSSSGGSDVIDNTLRQDAPISEKRYEEIRDVESVVRGAEGALPGGIAQLQGRVTKDQYITESTPEQIDLYKDFKLRDGWL